MRSYVGKDTVSVTVSDGIIRAINVKPVSGEADKDLIDELLISQCRDINYSSQNQDYVNRIYEVLYGHFDKDSSEPATPEISYTKTNDIITVTITGNNNVYYSIDGTKPSVLYTKPVVINTSDYENVDKIRVRAVAVDSNQSSEEKQLDIYTNTNDIFNSISFYQKAFE